MRPLTGAAVVCVVAIGSLVPIGTALLIGLTLNRPAPAVAAPIDHSVVSVSAVAEALYTPCPDEDSDNCYWDALTQGNGRGTSFVTVEGHVFYAPLTPEPR